MTTRAEEFRKIVRALQSKHEDRQIQAAMDLRHLATEVNNKEIIREAGGINAMLKLLDWRSSDNLVTVCTETLSCLAADDAGNKEAIKAAQGIERLVGLISARPRAECTHRALLALRILTEREADRIAILQAGGVLHLVRLLQIGSGGETTEYATAALGDLAAGSHALKDAIREAGGVDPLVMLVQQGPQEAAAELAAVALRNMAVQNSLNKEAIVAADGLHPLLQLLSHGQRRLQYPVQCEVMYKELDTETAAGSHSFEASQCCFDVRRAELRIACLSSDSLSLAGCFARSGGHGDPRDRHAERYSLLRKLTLTEPNEQTLELVFTLSDIQGAPRIVDLGQQPPPRRLQRIILSPCPAKELRGCIMKMLTRIHLEREFNVGKTAKTASFIAGKSLSQRLLLSGPNSHQPSQPITA